MHITQFVYSQPRQAVAAFRSRYVVELNAWRDSNKVYILTMFAVMPVELFNIEAGFPKPVSQILCCYPVLLRCSELHTGVFGIT